MSRAWTQTLIGAAAAACAAAGCAMPPKHSQTTACHWCPPSVQVSQHRDIYGPYHYTVISADSGPHTEFAIAQLAQATPTGPGSQTPATDQLAVAGHCEAGPGEDRPAGGEKVVRVRYETPAAPSAPPAPKLADVPAHGTHAHAPDYSWLSGQVQQWRKGWRLRYAPVDEVDAHGGSVTLVGEAALEGLRDGDLVRVHGRLVAAEHRGASPTYHVESLTPLRR